MFVLDYSINDTHIKKRKELRLKQQAERDAIQRLQSKDYIQAHKKEAAAKRRARRQKHKDN